ncbi:MAG: phosphodiester glycosidase family protein [Oscillospiraceae bacterium]|nr:phosphodiester glycosidase family protein [Oscillospiraceae bacterium]
MALNGDFCTYRKDGVIIRQGQLFRNSPSERQSLIVDMKGDLHIVPERQMTSDGWLERGIIQAFSFGPALVVDGQTKEMPSDYIYGRWKLTEPRSAIGQLGELHYLLAVVDGREPGYSEGINFTGLAELMASKGCKIAYNMDGGQSSTLFFNNKVINKVSNGGERTVSDVLFFATADTDVRRNPR